MQTPERGCHAAISHLIVPAGQPHSHHVHTARSSSAAYGIGLAHGAAGSAGIGVLLLAAIPDRGTGIVALVIFAGFTALSMAATSMLLGHLLAGRPGRGRFRAVTPALGVANLAFGAWYALGALGAVPYAL